MSKRASVREQTCVRHTPLTISNLISLVAGALGGDSGGVGGVGEVHRGSVGSVASYCRTSSAGSLSGPPTPTTGGPPNAPGAGPNTPLVIPQPVKPQSRVNKTYQCKMCDQVSI